MTNNLKELVKKNKKYVSEELDLNELIDKHLLSKQLSTQNKHSSFFHPSLISKGVECQIWWYFFLKNFESVPEDWSDESLTAMMIGSSIHDSIQKALYEMDMLEGVWECPTCGHKFWALSPKGECINCRQNFKSWNYLIFKEVPIQVGLIRGHADGIINKNGARFLGEFKSIKNVDRPNAQYGFEKVVATNRPMDDHYIQAQLYLYGWNEVVKATSLEEDILIDESGKLTVVKLDGPVHDGAKIIGPLNNGIIDYVAKNSSEKKSFLITKNQNSIQFLLNEMQIIWKAYLEDTVELLKGTNSKTSNTCKKCRYRKVCSWSI
jgi:hypothetical protein